MKKLLSCLFAVATLFVIAGCEDNLDVTSTRMSLRHLTIQATYENVTPASPDTKTVLHDDGHVYWTPGDAISLFYGSGSGGGSKFVAQATEETRVTNFSGEIGVVTGGDEISEDDTYFWGLYPYDATAVCDGQTITVRVADSQIGAPDTFSPGCAPSLGHDQGLMLSFRNLYTGLWFTVTETGYRSVTIRANNGELIAGRAKYGFGSDGLPEVKEILEGTDAVTVVAPTSDGFEVGKKYYILFFPQTLTGGFTLESISATEKGSFQITTNVTFQRNQISNVTNLDTKSTFEPITVTRANFPDEHFANYVFSNFDKNGDGELSETELNNVKTIRVCTDTVASLVGIDYFNNLTYLYCNGTVNWSKNVANGILTELDVSNNKKLQTFECDNNHISVIDVTNNTNLTRFSCNRNLISAIDVTNNTDLTYFSCYRNQLSSIDISNNIKLTHLLVATNPLGEIDLTNLDKLVYLEVYNNGLSDLDISNNKALEKMWCSGNELTHLNLSNNTALTQLYCENNSIEELDLSNNPALTLLHCFDNQLSSLDLRNNQQLTNLDCNPNKKLQLVYLHDDIQYNRIAEGNLDVPDEASIVYDDSPLLYEIIDPDENGHLSMLTDGSKVLLISRNGTYGASADTLILVSLETKEKTLIITDDDGYPALLFGSESLYSFDNDDAVSTLLQYVDGNIYSIGQIELEQTNNSRSLFNSTVYDVSSTKAKFSIAGFKKSLDVLENFSRKVDTSFDILNTGTELLSMIDNIYNNPKFRYIEIGVNTASVCKDVIELIGTVLAAPESFGSSLALTCICAAQLGNDFLALLEAFSPSLERLEAFKQYYIKEYGIEVIPLDASDIESTSATLNGVIQYSKPLNYTASFRLFTPAFGDRTIDVDSGITIQKAVSDLIPKTVYWYWLVIKFTKGGLDYTITSDVSTEFTTKAVGLRALSGYIWNEESGSTNVDFSMMGGWSLYEKYDDWGVAIYDPVKIGDKYSCFSRKDSTDDSFTVEYFTNMGADCYVSKWENAAVGTIVNNYYDTPYGEANERYEVISENGNFGTAVSLLYNRDVFVMYYYQNENGTIVYDQNTATKLSEVDAYGRNRRIYKVYTLYTLR